MKGAIILQHKYFIAHLDADLRRHIQNTNELCLPGKMAAALCKHDIVQAKGNMVQCNYQDHYPCVSRAAHQNQEPVSD